MLPSATYLEIEGAPHGMLWTHGEEINKACWTSWPREYAPWLVEAGVRVNVRRSAGTAR